MTFFIFKHLVFPIAELFNRTFISRRLRFLNKSQYWTKEKLDEYQNDKLAQLINYAYHNVPYYNKLFDRLKLKPSDIKTTHDLNKLPILTKKIVNENLEELRSRPYSGKSFIKLTSGSTGTPSKFYRAMDDYSWEWAAHYRAWGWAGYELGDKFVKISLNNDRDLLKKKIQDYLMRCLYLYVYKMDERQIDKYIEEILNYKPKIIYGYTSSIKVIADRMKERGLQYNAKAVITMGSKLTKQFRELIEDQFCCKVFDGYGCGGEGLNIAAQCEKGSYHTNDELIITEIVNGEIVITGLTNYAMPLIRYKPDDYVTMGDKCECGRALKVIKNVIGRSQEYVRTKSGSVLVVEFFISAFEFIDGIKQYKVLQNTLDGITLILVVNKSYNKTDAEKKIEEFILNSIGHDLKIDYQYVKAIPPDNNGKTKIIESRL
jgi:phenylacetate-CoA ligase